MVKNKLIGQTYVNILKDVDKLAGKQLIEEAKAK